MAFPKKTIYYKDALNDDFAGTKIKQKPLPKNFRYVSKNPFFRFFAMLIYRVIAMPILWIASKIGWSVKVKGKKNAKKVAHKGVFIYGNHTQICDAWTNQVFVSWRQRTHVLVNPDATSIKGIRWLVMMLGALPMPDIERKDDFMKAIETRIKQRRAIVVFPEAHIWPYCIHIRPYGDAAFVYPALLGTPVLPTVTTYKRRKFIFKNCHPKMVIHVGKAIYPDMKLSLPERRKELRDRVYEFMLDYATNEENAEYIRYLKAPSEEKKGK